MQLRAQPDHLGEPVKLDELRSVVIMDDYGNPLFVAQQIKKDVVVLYKHTDPKFREAVKALGIGLHTEYVGKKQ